MELVAVMCSGFVALCVAVLGYAQWRRTERRQAGHESASLRLAEYERLRVSGAAYRDERISALRGLTQLLKEMELESRWNGGGLDTRAREPELNAFLITHRAVLDDEELALARRYFEGLIWMDRAAEQSRLRWERERRDTLEASGVDIGPYESSWTTTALPSEPEGLGVADALREQQKWASASRALDERLRHALQGRD
ncbi:hypothetical protein [Streptomyces sp. NPDC005408]|uniref:hypothetical protein n=1 Tax=Streptomyces sp. NPDC005408 TaxID=3155341 RepID=UPI0033A8B615